MAGDWKDSLTAVNWRRNVAAANESVLKGRVVDLVRRDRVEEGLHHDFVNSLADVPASLIHIHEGRAFTKLGNLQHEVNGLRREMSWS
jgi:hypothetical protein